MKPPTEATRPKKMASLGALGGGSVLMGWGDDLSMTMAEESETRPGGEFCLSLPMARNVGD